MQKSGFVPALGTPLNENGELCVESYKKEIEDQINAGAIALLSMGSMGQQEAIRQEICPIVAKAAVEAAGGRVPVYVGTMDNSIARAKERIKAMEDLDIQGFVFTTPYYSASSRQEVINYFNALAKSTKKSILLYDLAVVTQTKITYDMVLELIAENKNIIGIKSADMQMFRKLTLNPQVPKDFIMVYSGLDTFDIAYKWGIDKCLDGMLSCTPKTTGEMFKAMENGDFAVAGECLNKILALRDKFITWDLWPAYSTAMNLLGYEGSFAPDYCSSIKDEYILEIKTELQKMGEL